ncbi:hypothetical protein [Algoriphagus boritolerans]
MEQEIHLVFFYENKMHRTGQKGKKMRTIISISLLLNIVLVCKAQTTSKSVFIQDFNNSVIKNLVLKIEPTNTNKKYMGYTLLIYVSKSYEIKISKYENTDGELRPVMEDLERNFLKSLDEIDITPFKGCLIVFPVIHKMISSDYLKDNFDEGVKSMIPMIKFETVDCIQFQEPIIVSGRRGI